MFDTSLASLPVEAKPDDAQSPAANRANSSQGAIPDTAKIPVLDKLTAKVAPTPQAIAPAGEPAVTKEAGLPISSPVAPSGTTANVVDTDVASPLPPPPAAQPAPLHDPAKPAQSGMGTATDLKTALKTADPAVVGPETGAMGRSQRNESSAIAAPAAGSPVDAQTGHAQPDHAQSPAPNPVGPSQGAIPDTAKISVLDKLPRETSPPPQPTTRAGEPAVPKEVVFSVSTPVAPSGTPVATYQERMKSAVKENEFAGSALQDLPSDGHIASSAGGAGGASQGAKAGQPVVIDFSTDRETSAQWAAVGITHAGTANLTVTANAGNAGTHAPSPVSQVERMISREVAWCGSPGAESLAVSLKVDSRTSLFLQLTNHNGQIEAAVRCEKGDAAALDATGAIAGIARAPERPIIAACKTSPFLQPASNFPPPTAWEFPGRASPPSLTDSRQPPSRNSPADDAMNVASDQIQDKPATIGLGQMGLILKPQPPARLRNGPEIMSTSSITAPTGQTAAAASQTLTQANFLQLLVTQMSSQDPLNPQSDTEFAAQLAQFSALQQSQDMSQNMSVLQANSMIGESVTVASADGSAPRHRPGQRRADSIRHAGRRWSTASLTT